MDSSASSLEKLVFPERLGLGRHLSPGVVRCSVSPACVRLSVEGWMHLSIDHRVLLAVERDLSQLRRFLWCLVFEVFSVYTTAVAYLRHQGGPLSSSLVLWLDRISGSLCDGFALRVKSVPACFWLCFVAWVFEKFSCLSFCASEQLSVASRPAFFVFFFSFLLFESSLFLAEPSDSFGSKGYLSDVVTLLDESQFRLVLWLVRI